jgi:hypothetical protein
VIGCEPTERLEVENVALPALRVPEPIADPLSRNVTVPVGVPLVEDMTVAVKVTDCPNVEVGELDVTVVDVPAWLTVTETALEVLVA